MYEFLGCFNVLRPHNMHVWIVYVTGFGNSEMSVNWLGFMFYHVLRICLSDWHTVWTLPGAPNYTLSVGCNLTFNGTLF